MGPHAERSGQMEHQPLGDELSNTGRTKRKLLITNKRDTAIWIYVYTKTHERMYKRSYDSGDRGSLLEEKTRLPNRDQMSLRSL